MEAKDMLTGTAAPFLVPVFTYSDTMTVSTFTSLKRYFFNKILQNTPRTAKWPIPFWFFE